MNFLTRFERWDPFDELTLLRNRMDRLLNKISDEETPALTTTTTTWAPTTDIVETKDALIVRCELPGIEEKDVNVEIENGVLTISGERKFEEKTKEKNFHRVERAYGRFVRSFTLPPNILNDNVKATFTEGLLELTLPKKEEAKPKKIHLQIAA
ncbi:MAG TPA: Hsp20/alpha crystallin family protein [Thermoanaerobaculia bacterium]|nr:Hsp20/alpha crystallin family protein [Thermoanaerobaculia bacterium]